MTKTIFSMVCLLLIAACTHSDGRYAVISDRPVQLKNLITPNMPVAETKAISRRHVLILIPFSKAPTASAAISAVLEQYKGDYLANAEIKLVNVQLMFWYHYKAWEVSGTVMRFRKQP